DEELKRVAETVYKIWEDQEFPQRVAAAPDYFRQYGLIYGALAPDGVTGGYHRATLEKLAPGGYLKPYGKSPHLRLETRYYADLAGLDHGFESYGELYAASILANRSAALPIDIEEGYRITHTVFHVTDFGCQRPGIPEDDRKRAYHIVDQLTDHFVEVNHWDLTAEFVLSQFCLGVDPTRTRSGAAGIRRLMEVQTPGGAIPGRFIEQRLDESAPADVFFRRAYHTTLVTALASMVILSAPHDG